MAELHERWAGAHRAWLIPKAAAGLLLLYASGSAAGPLAAYATATAVVVLAYLSFAVRRGRAPSDVGLGRRGAIGHTVAGFAGGAVLLSCVVAVFAAAGWYRVEGADPDLVAFLFTLGLFAFVAVFEEVLSRGMLFRWLERRSGSGPALVGSALVFGFLHGRNPGASTWSSLALSVEAGVLLAGAYMLTRTLWLPIGIHWSWNLVQGPVFGLPVSGMTTPGLLMAEVRGPELWTGGAFGPEAGLVAIAFGTAAGAVLVVLAARRGRWVRMPWRHDPVPVAIASISGPRPPAGNERDEHLVGGEAPVAGQHLGLTLVRGIDERDGGPGGEDDVPDAPSDDR